MEQLALEDDIVISNAQQDPESDDDLRMDARDLEADDDAQGDGFAEADPEFVCQCCKVTDGVDLDPGDPNGFRKMTVRMGRCIYHMIAHLFIWQMFQWGDSGLPPIAWQHMPLLVRAF